MLLPLQLARALGLMVALSAGHALAAPPAPEIFAPA
jgi:hypothetical protein